MGLFSWRNKNKKEDSENMTEDEKQERKAEEDISEKGKDSQTEKDRIDESVGEQEKRDGDENSQDAKDRVDESEGTEKADEKRDEDETKGKEERKEEMPEWAKTMLSVLTEMKDALIKNEEKGEEEERPLGVGLSPDEPMRTGGQHIRPPYLDKYRG